MLSKKTYYRVAVGSGWVGSPTNTITTRPAFVACLSDLAEAEMLAKLHGGKVEAGTLQGRGQFVVTSPCPVCGGIAQGNTCCA